MLVYLGCSTPLLFALSLLPAALLGGPPPDTPFFQKWVGEELQKDENQCLRTVAGAYKTTQVQSL